MATGANTRGMTSEPLLVVDTCGMIPRRGCCKMRCTAPLSLFLYANTSCRCDGSMAGAGGRGDRWVVICAESPEYSLAQQRGQQLGAYGDTYADTPHLDRRAMSAVETIAALPREQPGMQRQFDIYVPQLLDKILADLEP